MVTEKQHGQFPASPSPVGPSRTATGRRARVDVRGLAPRETGTEKRAEQMGAVFSANV